MLLKLSEDDTQTVESMWRDMKTRNKAQFGTARSMIDSYLCEFLWRKMIRNENAFDAILRDIVLFAATL